MAHNGLSIWIQTKYLSTSTTENYQPHLLKGAKCTVAFQVRPREPSGFLHHGYLLSAISYCLYNAQEVFERVAGDAHWQIVRD